MRIFLLAVVSVFAFASSYNQKMIESIKLTEHKQQGFSFAVMGDNRDGNRVLEKIITKINSDKDILFALNNGDLVPDGYEKEFANYLHLIKKSKKPIVSVVGNHEIPWYDGETNYQKIFGNSNFAFAYKNSYFIIVDSSDKELSKSSLQWLEDELRISQKYNNRFLFTHVPLYDPRKGEYKKGHSFKRIKQAKALNDLFDKYRVTMLFCSHIHFYYKGKWQNTPFIITGGAGAPLKKFKKSGFYNYVKVTVSDNRVEYSVVKIDAKAPTLIEESIQSIKDIFNL
jgi:hypothetical protein